MTRQSLEPDDRPVTVTAPDGTTTTLTLTAGAGGRSTGTLAVSQMGLYHLTDGSHNALAAAGPLNPIEFADVRATPDILAPLAAGERRRRVLGRRRRDPRRAPRLAPAAPPPVPVGWACEKTATTS